MRTFLSLLFLVLQTASVATLKAQQLANSIAKPKVIAILPTIMNVNRTTLRADIDSVSLSNIQKAEAYNTQLKNYHLLSQKSKNYNVLFQPFNQTNNLLEQAGINYETLAQVNQKELANILGVDMIFYGVNYREPDPNTPEERLAINVAATLILPLSGLYARNADTPITTFHYLLFDNSTNRTIWHFKDTSPKPGTNYLESFRHYMFTHFPARR